MWLRRYEDGEQFETSVREILRPTVVANQSGNLIGKVIVVPHPNADRHVVGAHAQRFLPNRGRSLEVAPVGPKIRVGYAPFVKQWAANDEAEPAAINKALWLLHRPWSFRASYCLEGLADDAQAVLENGDAVVRICPAAGGRWHLAQLHPVRAGDEVPSGVVFTLVAITNTAKHAAETAIHVRLAVRDDALSLEVRDNGAGIHAVDEASEGLGIHTMQYPAELIGCQFDIGAPESGGTLVQCLFPLTRDAAPGSDEGSPLQRSACARKEGGSTRKSRTAKSRNPVGRDLHLRLPSQSLAHLIIGYEA